MLLGGPGALERGLRSFSLGYPLGLRVLRLPFGQDFITAVHASSLVVIYQEAASANLPAVCERLRHHTFRPVLALTLVPDEDLTVAVLAAGADDCLPVWTPLPEIVARIRALLRRDGEYGVMRAGRRYEVGELHLDTETHEATLGGKVVALTPREFQLLAALAATAGRPARREDLLQKVWGCPSGMTTRTLDVHIGRLRQKIECDPAQPRIIITVPGVGYRLTAA